MTFLSPRSRATAMLVVASRRVRPPTSAVARHAVSILRDRQPDDVVRPTSGAAGAAGRWRRRRRELPANGRPRRRRRLRRAARIRAPTSTTTTSYGLVSLRLTSRRWSIDRPLGQSTDPFVIQTIRNAEALFIAGGTSPTMSGTGRTRRSRTRSTTWSAKPALNRGHQRRHGDPRRILVLVDGRRESLDGRDGARQSATTPRSRSRRNFRCALAPLRGIITDQHLWERDRIGRTVALLARLVQDGWTTDGTRDRRATARQPCTSIPSTMTAEVFATRDHPTPYAYFMRTTARTWSAATRPAADLSAA